MQVTTLQPQAGTLAGALGGLQGTNEFKTLIATDLQLLGSFEAIELAFSVGSRGKRCL